MKYLITVNVVLAMALGFLMFSFFTSTKRIVYIDTAKVFSEFRMTKELDKQVTVLEDSRKVRMDSLNEIGQKLQSGIIKLSEQELLSFKNIYLNKQKTYADEIARMKQSSIEKIWKQINQFVSDFGKEKRIDVILGANGQGSLMYAKEKIDITNDIIVYINEKYDGKN